MDFSVSVAVILIKMQVWKANKIFAGHGPQFCVVHCSVLLMSVIRGI